MLMAGMVQQHTINFVHGFHSMGRTTVVDVGLEGMHGSSLQLEFASQASNLINDVEASVVFHQ